MKRDKSEEERLAQELLRSRDDPNEWSEAPVEVEVRPPASHVLSVRIPIDELDTLLEAKERAGESVSEYVRKAIALRTHGVPIGPSVQLSHVSSKLTIRSYIVTEQGTQGGFFDFGDLPSTVSNLPRHSS